MTTVFLNTKLNGTTETLDHLVKEDFPTFKDFRTEQRRLKEEYILAGGHGSPYWSSRSVKSYK